VKSSRAEESHPHPLLDPDVNVAIHLAPDVQPCFKVPSVGIARTAGIERIRPVITRNPRLSIFDLIGESSLQTQNLEVADERDAIVAVETAQRCSSLVV
jgi:hypothetical protein